MHCYLPASDGAQSMTQTSDIFDGLLSNLQIDNSESISSRRDEITRVLNLDFRDSESTTSNRLMVGSYGRRTAIKGISDLDLLYLLPSGLRSTYESDGGPAKVLSRTRQTIQNRYPSTSVKVDRLVVVVEFTNFVFEVQPVFENSDASFSYPDTYVDSWKVTKPRAEISATADMETISGGSLRVLCKLTRAWRNKHGAVMGGLLVDTLACNYLDDYKNHHNVDSESYDLLFRDFLLFLSEQIDHDFYLALGSRQHVKVKKKFQKKAKKGYDLCEEAIDAAGQSNAYKKWRKVFGNSVPIVAGDAKETGVTKTWTDSEEFVEDVYPVDIRHTVEIDCIVTQDGFRPQSLRSLLKSSLRLQAQKNLSFAVLSTSVVEPFDVRWKVLNQGPEAERRDKIRGQIVKSTSKRERREVTNFRGDHYVECYIIKNGVVVARDDINVPITT